MSFIRCDQIAKRYGQGHSLVTAVDQISMSLDSGEFIAIMGESGAGKSTLLSILGAMNRPNEGHYLVDGIDVYALSIERQADFRREYLGFVFQSFHLIPYLTVVENVMLPLTAIRMPNRNKRDMAMEALAWVGLENKGARLPNQISGGEMERVAIARAIVNNPPILLADEPTGNLDSGNSRMVMTLLERLNQQGTTVIMVTHSDTCAAHAGRTMHLRDGRFMETPSIAHPFLVKNAEVA
jgi:putative ABC transport system ATP-binding protein